MREDTAPDNGGVVPAGCPGQVRGGIITPKYAKPKVEVLEGRVCPSTYSFTNGDNNWEWADSKNWSSLDGGTSYPNAARDSATLGNFSGTIKYENFGGNTVSGALGTLIATNIFTGTLNLQRNLQLTNSFGWQGGILDPGSNTLELSVGAGSSWGGGTIGNGNSNGTFKIDNGTTLTISPYSSQVTSVTLGVPLFIGGDGTTTKVLVRNINVNMPTTSTVTTTVNTGGTLEFGATTAGQSRTFGPSSQVNSDYIKGVGGNITFDPGYVWDVNAAIWNVGATVQFQDGAVITLTNGSTATSSRSYYQSVSGTTILGSTGGTNGAALYCDQGFWQTNGSFQTYSTTKQELFVGTRSPQIAYFTGGTIKVGADLTGDNYGWLQVWGALDISGTTTVYVSVSLANANNRTQIETTGSFTIDASAPGGNQTTVNVTTQGMGMVTQWTPFYSETTGSFYGQFAYVSIGYSLQSDGTNDVLKKV
jgi:hypothetical protein